MGIEELKHILGADTSEKLFGFREQPEENCPKVDLGKKAWYSAKCDIGGYCTDLKRCDSIEQAENIGDDIEWIIERLDIDGEYEELREQCANIRAWGQEWKNIAKKLIEKQSDVSELLADEFFTKLETVDLNKKY